MTPRPPSSTSAPTCSPTRSPPRPSRSPGSTGGRRWRAPRPTSPRSPPTRAGATANERALGRDARGHRDPGRRRARPRRLLGLERGRVPARRAADRVGARLRPAARRADGRRRARGPGRRTRRTRSRSSSPAPRSRSSRATTASTVGPMAGVVTPSMWLFVLEDARQRAAYVLLAQRGARQGAAVRRLLPRGADPAALDGRRARPAAAAGGARPPVRSTSPGSSPRCCRWATRPTTATAPGTLMLLRDLAPAMVTSGCGRRPTSPRRCGSSAATTTSSSTSRCRPASSRSTRPAASTARRWSWRWPATAPTSASRSPAPATSGSPARPSSPTGSTSATTAPTTPTRTSATRRSPRPPASAASRWPPRRRSSGSSAARCPTRWRPPAGCTRSPSARTRAGRCRSWSSRARRPASTSPRSAGPGSCPQINTGMAGKVAGVGQVGAGLVTPPAEIFPKALARLAELASATLTRPDRATSHAGQPRGPRR